MSYDCRDCRDEIPARDAGSLSALAQARVDAHLASCEDCRNFRARYGALLAAGRAWTPAPTPEDRDGFYSMVTPSTGSPAVVERTWRRFVAAGASLAVAAVLALFVVLRGDDAPARPRDPETIREARRELVRAIDRGHPEDAVERLTDLVRRWPGEAAEARRDFCPRLPADAPVCDESR